MSEALYSVHVTIESDTSIRSAVFPSGEGACPGAQLIAIMGLLKNFIGVSQAIAAEVAADNAAKEQSDDGASGLLEMDDHPLGKSGEDLLEYAQHFLGAVTHFSQYGELPDGALAAVSVIAKDVPKPDVIDFKAKILAKEGQADA